MGFADKYKDAVVGERTLVAVDITPEMASEWLATGKEVDRYRKISQQRVNSYEEDMKVKDRWQYENGETIKFTVSGILVDGFHRLDAIVKKKKTERLFVDFNIPDHVCVFDKGRPRSTSDTLVIGGMDKKLANGRNVAAAKLHFAIRCGDSSVSDWEVERFILKHGKVLQKVNAITGTSDKSKPSVRNASLALASMYAIESGEPFEKVGRFIEVYRDGFPKGPSENAAIVCRNDYWGRTFTPGGGIAERKRAEFIYEKAIYDFCRDYPREKSYRGVDKPTYGDNEKFKVDKEVK
jgi:hypothetical protein